MFGRDPHSSVQQAAMAPPSCAQSLPTHGWQNLYLMRLTGPASDGHAFEGSQSVVLDGQLSIGLSAVSWLHPGPEPFWHVPSGAGAMLPAHVAGMAAMDLTTAIARTRQSVVKRILLFFVFTEINRVTGAKLQLYMTFFIIFFRAEETQTARLMQKLPWWLLPQRCLFCIPRL